MPQKDNTTTTGINTLFFTNGTASHAWRIDGIANRANRSTEHSIYVTEYTRWNRNIIGADIVVLEMVASPDIVKVCHEQGAKVIYEADDATLDTYGEERKNLQKIEGSHKEMTKQVLNEVDAITVTSETLKQNYARYTDKPIYVLPNYVDYEWYGEEKLNLERTTDEIRIGWFGSQGHLEDLQMITPAIKQVLENYPEAKFVYCGFGGMSSDYKVTEIGWGEDVFKDLPRERREFHIGVREDYWPMKHRYLDLDIGICPLIDDEFNKNKTPIKWMEFSVLGTPTVCSPTLYEDVVDHGRSGYIANDTSQWVDYLSMLIESRSARTEIGDKAKALIKAKYNLDDHWHKWFDVYSEVLGRV